jgi:1,4-dihydroxy-2-naphthoate octaprenyltransferase
MAKIKIYFLETRPHFLVLSVMLAFLGSAMAWYYRSFHLGHALLAFLGLLLLHISTNVLNDYFDFKHGIDLKTKPTPFSGGSGFVISGQITPGETLTFGLLAFFLAAPIGLYFLIRTGWILLPLFILGAIFVLLGTSYLTKVGFAVGELAAGLGLGALPVLGINIILRQQVDLATVYACIPSGILVFNLLFLNEFPDREADQQGGRRTLAITLGLNRAGRVYAVLSIMVYVWIVIGVVLQWMPAFTLLGLFTLPFCIRAIKGALNPTDPKQLLPALGANIVMILGTQFVLGIGYILSRIIG